MPTDLPTSNIEEATSRILTKQLTLSVELARRARAIEAAPEESPPTGVIITQDAERELFARVGRIATDEDELEFFGRLEHAMTKALARDERRIWLTQTMKRFCCRLHFFRSGGRVFLLACVALDEAENEDRHST